MSDEFGEQEKNVALAILMTCIEAARRKMFTMRVAGKRPNMRELESIAHMLYLAECRVNKMAGIPSEPMQPEGSFYSEDWSEEVARVLGFSDATEEIVRH